MRLRNIVANICARAESRFASFTALLTTNAADLHKNNMEPDMQLGVFVKDPKTGAFTGSIRTLSSVVDHVEIVPTPKRSEAAPDFRVYGPTGSDFGAGWNKLSRDGGKPYISLVLRDPAFNNGQPLYPILVQGDDGQFVMAWEASDAARAPARPTVTPSEAATADALPAPAPGKRQK
jgi:uncharacterized protein (DUF736 family)